MFSRAKPEAVDAMIQFWCFEKRFLGAVVVLVTLFNVNSSKMRALVTLYFAT